MSVHPSPKSPQADLELPPRNPGLPHIPDDRIPPMPNVFGCPVGIEALVCADITRRQQMGIKKYGKQLADNPAGEIERLQHAYEEALDLANYLKWQIERKKQEMLNEMKLVVSHGDVVRIEVCK